MSNRPDSVQEGDTRPPVMDLAEFRDAGYLMEVNRQFFHPRGLAMFLVCDGGEFVSAGIYDGRDDPEGWRFDDLTAHDAERAAALDAAAQEFARVRLDRFGYVVQPHEEPIA